MKPDRAKHLGSSHDADNADRVIVVVQSSINAMDAVRLGHHLATSYGVAWEAIIPQTSHAEMAGDPELAGEALKLAAQLGAIVSRISAATYADAIGEHIEVCRRPHVVIEIALRNRWRRLLRPSLPEELIRRYPKLTVHLVGSREASTPNTPSRSVPFQNYAWAAGASLLMLGVVFLLSLVSGTTYLSILFLFPVIAAATRLGLGPALLGAVLSAIGFNVFFLSPLRAFDPYAAQTWLMLAVLCGIAIHTSWMTGTLRSRLKLSDRNARESAALTAFAQELTRVSDWTSTGEVVCREFHNLLGLRALVVREVAGELNLVSSLPIGAALDPLDKTALQWSWEHVVPTGAGTGVLSEASWQFQPLATSLGVLAILGLARDDGRDPIPADRQILLGTMIAQAALAHERLRLEDGARRED